MSETGKDIYCTISRVCGIHKARLIKKRVKQMVLRAWGFGSWGAVVQGQKLASSRQISPGDLMHSLVITDNSIISSTLKLLRD